MKVSADAYSLLDGKLFEIENTATSGILQKNPRDCCVEIKNIVFEIRQILKNEFYTDGSDEPPAA
ncbi:hypothetical protein [Treponema phagedenis]|uniref:Uncharacterized protein n=1 Tax=Treponema phagedenis TaxID=162 RepID=A0AAE6IRN9_TREPH|nr:hypothetical protein [Treponema phagedenis]QEJ97102.1 hypothetical protein FUT82_03280 [Treponema phagedenis]QEJ99845.1 hypothetical protein FUT84_00715 [Treponema phagedenis]QEK02708.1 hypothetical protein FUT83_02055 [Treponema phagedenis]QEK08337.1 hypothetical protein FUT81_02040 [Treponema phagedenis]QSH95079.1 hypothetical protein C5O78_08520 [Treponema phagedenis]